jgi:hypothetical protein
MTIVKTVASDFGFGGSGRAGSADNGWKLLGYKPNPKASTAKAFFDAKSPSGLIFHGLILCEDQGKCWVGIPGVPQITAKGDLVRSADGRIVYRPIIKFANADARERFTAQLFELLRSNGAVQ